MLQWSKDEETEASQYEQGEDGKIEMSYNSNQQRGLVAVTIRGSVLFYSSAIWRPDFRSVNREFWYLYGVDSIELKTLFYRWKMCRNHHEHWKNTKSESESRRC